MASDPGSGSDGEVVQWAKSVIRASSTEEGYDVQNILGRRRVYPLYGNSRADTWSPSAQDGKQFVELEFGTAVYITRICIYETFHAGSVVRISIRDPSGKWQSVSEQDKAELLMRSRIYSPNIQRTAFKSNAVRLDFVQLSSITTAIDAVAIFGYESRQPDDGRQLVVESSKQVSTANQ